NYALSGGLHVVAATLQSDGGTVVLNTSPQTGGATYTVTVNNVMDLAFNSVPPNSQATFRAGTPIRVSIQRTGSICVISWEPPLGVLEAAENPGGMWTPLLSATNPNPVSIVNGNRFYRVVVP